ncbi:ABC transporter permease subunit, partial [Rhizobium ruizarguesonis]
VGYLLGGVIVVEEIFSIPGIGRQLIVAIHARDLPAIQAGLLIMAATYSIFNFIADILYAWRRGYSRYAAHRRVRSAPCAKRGLS